MKPYLLYVFLLAGLHARAQQDSIITPDKWYKAAIKESNGQTHYGSLLYLTDSVTVLSISKTGNQQTNILQNQKAFPFQKVESIQLQRKGSVGRGMLWGGLSGALAGVIVGYMSGDDKPVDNITFPIPQIRFTAAQKAGFLGVLGGIGGTAIGGIIGAVTKKTFIIGGKKENHDLYRQTVLEMANSGRTHH